jgi:Putative 2OG-Fe(II) oxygenase
LPQELCRDILARGRHPHTDHSRNLAGVVERQYLLGEDDRKHIESVLQDPLWAYVRQRARYYGEKADVVSMELDEVWINVMRPGDFNPPHNHVEGNISFVRYLQIPGGFKEEYENNKSPNARPGIIEFYYGQPGYVRPRDSSKRADLLIFTAQLIHFVQPYSASRWAVFIHFSEDKEAVEPQG